MPVEQPRAPASWRIALESILLKRAEAASDKAVTTRIEADYKEAAWWTRFLNKPDPEVSLDDRGSDKYGQS